MSSFDRPFGHFMRVLVDLDLQKKFIDKILVERVGFAFFVDIEYEKVPDFYSFFSSIGHTVNTCKRKVNSKDNAGERKQNKVDITLKGKKVVEVVEVDTNSEEEATKDQTKQDNNLVAGVTSNKQALNALVDSTAVVNYVTKPSTEEEGNSESEYIDDTLMVEEVPETQIDEAHRKQITDFLQDSWDNLADKDKDDDQGVDLLPEKDFKLVTSKRRKGKKSLAQGNTRLVSSQPPRLQ
ncbi:uncharacterized protein LOC131648650 [Vicia villosa]|uniref:uncharacterized protein LOC131648650 n=1 Tax=Vicia villosa TaxID=3911 RepID=UPI00273B58F3|nr:uncharacterized protein LOC131648650 [Vicia villosa]